jgi:pilus assembly protein CpaB
MNQRMSAILVVALLVSAGATYAVYRLITSRASQAPVTEIQVIQASRNLEIGTLIKDADLKAGPWLGDVPAGMTTKKETLVGRGVIAPIYAGEAIMETRLAPAGAGGGLAATIPPGMRACAVKVDEIVGLAGFVVPGMKVDVLISGNPPGSEASGRRVKTLLQNIAVLSAGQNYQKDAEGKPVSVQVVNLLVNPEQAEVLSLASNETRIQLILRNPLDTEPTKVPGSAMANLFGTQKPEAAPRPRVAPLITRVTVPAPERVMVQLPPFQIEVINGPQRTEAKFARPPVQEERK